MLEVAATIAGYRIERVLGKGGMGVVYEATQLSLDRRIALKVIASDFGDDPEFRERFRREGMQQAALDHPHIVPVFEAGESDGHLFIAMRLIKGSNVKEIGAAGDLTAARTLTFLTQVASALDAAHAAGRIHRDVKPQNILVDGEFAYLADFGLTKGPEDRNLTKSGRQVGSLDYISPEQIRGETATGLSDVYALAAVLYECLSGDVPYPRESDAALLYAHLSEPPRPLSLVRPELPAEIDEVIRRGMAKDPAERPRSAGDLMHDAETALAAASAPVQAPTRARSEPVPRRSETVVDAPRARPAPTAAVTDERRRIPLWAYVAGAIAAVGIAVAVGLLIGGSGGSKTASQTAAHSSAISVSYPAGWHPGAFSVPGLPLLHSVTLANAQGAHFAAGLVPTTQSNLLPTSFTHRIAQLPKATGARLGSLPAYRYGPLRVRGAHDSMTVFALPTSKGAVLAVCSPAAATACESIAATLTLTSAKPYPLGPSSAFAKAVDQALTTLSRARLKQRSALADAMTPTAQATAAVALASAYRAAATASGHASPRLVERAAQTQIVHALQAGAWAYVKLAGAARTNDTAAFRGASSAASAADAQLAAALARLQRAGYTVR